MAAGVHWNAPALLVAAVAGTDLGFSVPFGPLFALAYPWLVGELVAATGTYAAGFVAMSATVVGVWWLWRTAIGDSESPMGR